MRYNNDLPKGWKYYSLKELGEIARGKSKHRPRNAKFLYGGSYPFIQTGDVKASGGRITTYSQTYSEEGLKQSRMWPKGTMCITIAANIAETGILQFDSCFPDSVVGFIANPEKCLVEFVEYYFRLIRNSVQQMSSQTAQENINLKTLDRIRIATPPIEVQKKIVSILSAYDDKIENSICIIKNLEEQASILFNHWFVDYEFPNSQGKSYKSQNGKFDNDLPVDWNITNLSEIADINMGQSPPSSTYNKTGEGLPFYQGVVDFGLRYPEISTYCSKPKKIAELDDILLSVRAPVGELNRASIQCCIGRGVAAIRHKNGYNSFLFYALQKNCYALHAAKNGSIFDAINKQVLLDMKIVLPPEKIVEKFEEIVKPMDEMILKKTQEIKVLKEMRDLLLLLLMSGKINAYDIKAEREVEICY
ncbi:restriction endonuclease subunit S [Priestia megaterium]|uniref:restriction endonuclease subunit S n=1 Tax=Priestia megaterium TaxID=1404 RepID=UPI001FB4211A|nr:restriction endonuclease subunit S [Priestia megaterium]